MGKTSLEYLFTPTRASKPTREWADLLRANKDKYASSRVVSFTRVKDLNSEWKHEYVQFIVEETSSKDRARVYSERMNEMDLDQVTFGPAETKATGSKHKADLPLPLTSLVFGGESGDDVDKRPTVLQVAEILSATTLIGGGYELFGHSCFWFSYASYDAVKRQFGKWAKEKAWRWFDIGGAGGAGFKDAIGLGWTMLFKYYYVSDAKKFKKERETNLNWYGDGRYIIDTRDVVGSVTSHFEQDDNQNEYIASMRAQGIEIDNADIQKLIQASQEHAQAETDKNIDWSEEFDKSNQAFVDWAFANPMDAQKYLQYYQGFELPSEMAGGEADQGPKVENAGETTQALQITVGRILEEALKHNTIE